MAKPTTVANNAVYFTSAGYLYAVSKQSGGLLWQKSTSGISYSAPAVAGSVVYADGIDAFNAQTGDYMWQPNADVYSSPAAVNGIVYATSFLGSELCAFDSANRNKLWNYSTGGNIGFAPAISNGSIFFTSYNGNVYSLNAANGCQLWNYTIGPNVGCCPAIAGGIVYITYNGAIYALNATTGVKLWNYTMDTDSQIEHISDPVVSDGRLFVSYGNSIFALGNSPEPSRQNAASQLPNELAIIIAITVIALATVTMLIRNKRRHQKHAIV